jgi:hypothetical protein
MHRERVADEQLAPPTAMAHADSITGHKRAEQQTEQPDQMP